jgi:hypothetical protein
MKTNDKPKQQQMSQNKNKLTVGKLRKMVKTMLNENEDWEGDDMDYEPDYEPDVPDYIEHQDFAHDDDWRDYDIGADSIPGVDNMDDYDINLDENPTTSHQSPYMDVDKFDNVEWDGIDKRDSPDFSDAYIVYAEYDGHVLTDDELENLDTDVIYELLIKHLY